MRKSRFFALLVLTAPLLLAAAAWAQDAPLDVEAGYRYLDLSGDEGMYRSQINERDGFVLRNLNFASNGNPADGKWFDHIRVDASELGVGPAGNLRIEAGLTDAYRMTLTYRRTELYSSLPEFANPLLDQGIVPGQHNYDRERESVGFDLELRRWKSFTPFIGYRWDRLRDPGTTTYHVGQDEFLLHQDLYDRVEELRIGTGINAGFLTGEISQAWRTGKESETLKLAPGAGDGNNPGTVLGIAENLTSFSRETSVDSTTPVTNGYLTARLGSNARFTANYSTGDAAADTDQNESLAGKLVSYQVLRIFNGLSEVSSLSAKDHWWRGGGRLEVDLLKGVDFSAGWTRQHQELDGAAYISDIYLQTVSFGGGTPTDLLKILEASNSLERNETIVDAGIKADLFGNLTLRAGFSNREQEVTNVPDPSEIVVPAGQSGVFDREIRQYDAGATFTMAGFTAGADWRQERADDPIVRTDFLDRDRYRVRLAYAWKSFLRVTATGSQLDTSNDRDGIGYDARIRQYGGMVDVTPIESLQLVAGADRYQADEHHPHPRAQHLGDRNLGSRRGRQVVERRDSLEGLAARPRRQLLRLQERGELPVRGEADPGPRRDRGQQERLARRRVRPRRLPRGNAPGPRQLQGRPLEHVRPLAAVAAPLFGFQPNAAPDRGRRFSFRPRRSRAAAPRGRGRGRARRGRRGGRATARSSSRGAPGCGAGRGNGGGRRGELRSVPRASRGGAPSWQCRTGRRSRRPRRWRSRGVRPPPRAPPAERGRASRESRSAGRADALRPSRAAGRSMRRGTPSRPARRSRLPPRRPGCPGRPRPLRRTRDSGGRPGSGRRGGRRGGESRRAAPRCRSTARRRAAHG